MNREQKETELIAALNKATDTSKGFFLMHLGQFDVGEGKIRDLVMKLDADDFNLFHEEEMENLKCGLDEPGELRGGRAHG